MMKRFLSTTIALLALVLGSASAQAETQFDCDLSGYYHSTNAATGNDIVIAVIGRTPTFGPVGSEGFGYALYQVSTNGTTWTTAYTFNFGYNDQQQWCWILGARPYTPGTVIRLLCYDGQGNEWDNIGFDGTLYTSSPLESDYEVIHRWGAIPNSPMCDE